MELVQITQHIPDLIVDMRYASNRNITGKVLYSSWEPQLQVPAAHALQAVADNLRAHNLRLVVWDAFRPLEAQRELLAINNDNKYVLEDSKHCKGLAIDVTLADSQGAYLDMGTDHDDFSPKAHVGAQDLSEKQKANRKLLSQAMYAAGFVEWPYEWWHFDYAP